jgi:hypothetical protein
MADHLPSNPNPLTTPTRAAETLAALYDQLETTTNLVDLDNIQKRADALHHMAGLAKLHCQWQNRFFGLRIHALCRWGEIYAAAEKNKGGDPLLVAEGGQTLAEMGVSYNFSSECQRLSRIPKEVLHAYLASGEAADEDSEVAELSKAGLFAFAKAAAEPAPITPEPPKPADGVTVSPEPPTLEPPRREPASNFDLTGTSLSLREYLYENSDEPIRRVAGEPLPVIDAKTGEPIEPQTMPSPTDFDLVLPQVQGAGPIGLTMQELGIRVGWTNEQMQIADETVRQHTPPPIPEPAKPNPPPPNPSPSEPSQDGSASNPPAAPQKKLDARGRPIPDLEGIDTEVVNGITKILDDLAPKYHKDKSIHAFDWKTADIAVSAWLQTTSKRVRVDENRAAKAQADAICKLCESFDLDAFNEPAVEVATNPAAGTIELWAWSEKNPKSGDRTVIDQDGSNPAGAGMFEVIFWNDIVAQWETLCEFHDYDVAVEFRAEIEDQHFTEWSEAEVYATDYLASYRTEMADRGLLSPEGAADAKDAEPYEEEVREICKRLEISDDQIDDPEVRAAIFHIGEEDAETMKHLIETHSGHTLGEAFYALCTISDPIVDLAEYVCNREFGVTAPLQTVVDDHTEMPMVRNELDEAKQRIGKLEKQIREADQTRHSMAKQIAELETRLEAGASEEVAD